MINKNTSLGAERLLTFENPFCLPWNTFFVVVGDVTFGSWEGEIGRRTVVAGSQDEGEALLSYYGVGVGASGGQSDGGCWQ